MPNNLMNISDFHKRVTEIFDEQAKPLGVTGTELMFLGSKFVPQEEKERINKKSDDFTANKDKKI